MSKKKSYADMKQELESILEQLQASDVSVEQALALHEKGTELLVKLEAELKAHELKIVKAKKTA